MPPKLFFRRTGRGVSAAILDKSKKPGARARVLGAAWPPRAATRQFRHAIETGFGSWHGVLWSCGGTRPAWWPSSWFTFGASLWLAFWACTSFVVCFFCLHACSLLSGSFCAVWCLCLLRGWFVALASCSLLIGSFRAVWCFCLLCGSFWCLSASSLLCCSSYAVWWLYLLCGSFVVLTCLYFCLVALFVPFGACASFAVRFGACLPLVCFARFVPIFSYDCICFAVWFLAIVCLHR